MSTLGEIYSAQWYSGNFRIFYSHFDPSMFDTSLFEKVGIDLPSRIAASVAKRQAEYFFGRLCGRTALESIGLTNVQIGTGVFREPVWPAGYTGSITHISSIAAAVAVPKALCAGIGIDIETVCKGDTSDSLRATVVTQRELDCLESFDGNLCMDTLLTLAFSAKESFYKSVFGLVLRVLNFDAIELVRIDMAANALCFETREHMGGQFVPGYRFQVEFKVLDNAQVMTLFHLQA